MHHADPIDTKALIAVFRHSLKYINFMVVEYVEFKQRVSEKLVGLTSKDGKDGKGGGNVEWGVVRVDV